MFDMSDLKVDVRVKTKRNKVDIATDCDMSVRLTHTPTGIVVESHEESSQLKNKDKCLELLEERLAHMKFNESNIGTRTVFKSEKINTCSNCNCDTNYLDYCTEAGICSPKCYDEFAKRLANWRVRIPSDELDCVEEEKVDVKAIEVVVDDFSIEDFNFYECMGCHWRFVGDTQRFGYNGYTSEGSDAPNFCPMCGKKIGELID